MALWHGYIGMEDLNLNVTQRQTLVAEIQGIGQENSHPNPSRRMHWRVRLDNRAVIFEATFEDSALSIQVWKNRLGTIFGVDPATIDHTINTPAFGSGTSVVVTFARLGTNYLRTALFGGASATHEQSRQEALTYLSANAAVWGDG